MIYKEKNSGMSEKNSSQGRIWGHPRRIRHELQTLTDRPSTPQTHPEACPQNSHDEILREIQSLRDTIIPSVSTCSPSYADVAHIVPDENDEIRH
jgi:hypothetical protein